MCLKSVLRRRLHVWVVSLSTSLPPSLARAICCSRRGPVWLGTDFKRIIRVCIDEISHSRVTMEQLRQNNFIKLPSGTLEGVRKCWNLDKPGQMKEAVTVLEEWAKKQPHFLQTDFDLQFLENAIISSKGSIERAKVRLDKYCTMKTLMPRFYKKHDYHKSMLDMRPVADMAILPRLTSDYYRIIFGRVNNYLEPHDCLNFFIHDIIGMEYLKKNDYFNGLIIIADLRCIDFLPFFNKLNLMDFRELLTILIEGYTVRVGGVHLLTESKVIDILIKFLKQVLKPSISNRIKVHNSEESLYECIDRDLLPAEYGGKEKTTKELHDDMIQTLGSTEHMEYMERMRKYGTNETLRPKDNFNEHYLGMPGTFRMLSVD